MSSKHSQSGMPPANPVAAAILVELIPELKYAAPVLLERYDRGEPLIHLQRTATLDSKVAPSIRCFSSFSKPLCLT